MSFSASIAALVEEGNSPLVARAPSWERVALSEIATILNGYPWKSIHFNADRGVPVIRIRDVTSGVTDTLYDGEIEEGYWVDDGDLLVGMDGDFNCRVWAGGRALLNQRVCRISLNTGLYSASLLASVLPGYLSLVNDQTHSVTVKHLSSKTLADCPLPLPPLSEQRRIVAKLDSLSSKSKRAREHLDHIPRLVEKYKQAVLAAAFRGDLTLEWRKNNAANAVPSADLLLAARAELTKASPITLADTQVMLPPFDLPSEWSWTKAQAVCGFITKGTTPNAKDMHAGVGEIPFIKVYNLTFSGDLDFSVEPTFISKAIHRCALQRSIVRPGDVLMNIVDPPLGKVSVVPSTNEEWNINQAIAVFRPTRWIDADYLSKWFLSQVLLDEAVGKAKATAGQSNLTLEICRNLPVPLCSMLEQKEIVRRVEAAFRWIDRLAVEATSARKLIDKLDLAVLAKAFRGELVPQDPNDEPASVLLERIRAERETAPAAKPRRGRGKRS